MPGHRKVTTITLEDHERLKTLLLSKPRAALCEFRRAQVECLAQLELFWEIVEENPDASHRIILEAAEMHIPVWLPGMREKHEIDLISDDDNSNALLIPANNSNGSFE